MRRPRSCSGPATSASPHSKRDLIANEKRPALRQGAFARRHVVIGARWLCLEGVGGAQLVEELAIDAIANPWLG